MSLPMMLDLVNKKVLVIGGGKIGSRKVLNLLDSQAIVTCISSSFIREISLYKEKVSLIIKDFEPSDIKDYFLVIAATNDVRVNKRVYETCNNNHILCQTVDRINKSDFDFMATKRWDDLVVAVSTYGKAPAYSKELIKSLAEVISKKELDMLKKEINNRKQNFNSENEHKEEV